jgi:formylglycine-generating enzyme required for sulfatase activity
MPALWPELTTVETFVSLSDTDRHALAARVAAALGAEHSAHPELVGAARFAAVRHAPTGLLLVAVPGGRYTMGLREAEIDDMRRTVFGEDPKQRFDREVGGWHLARTTPAHQVDVAPFLCATGFVHHDGRAESEEEDASDEDPWLDRGHVIPLVHILRGHGLRLLSEAEWEWIAREGGRRSWIIDVTGRTGMALDDLREAPENGWGIRRLKSDQGELVADAWHASYAGAPTDSRAWDPDPSGVPGVHRGAHNCWQDDAEAITCHAAVRGSADGTDGGAVRPARNMP